MDGVTQFCGIELVDFFQDALRLQGLGVGYVHRAGLLWAPLL
jgi:hypothetical protein